MIDQLQAGWAWLTGLPKRATLWWNDFAGGQGHSWLAHYAIVRGVTHLGHAFGRTAGVTVGLVMVGIYIVREVGQAIAGNKAYRDAFFDAVWPMLGAADAIAWYPG